MLVKRNIFKKFKGRKVEVIEILSVFPMSGLYFLEVTWKIDNEFKSSFTTRCNANVKDFLRLISRDIIFEVTNIRAEKYL